MQIGSAYDTGSLWGIEQTQSQGSKGSLDSAGQSTGDTAEISAEARRLFSEMIHKYDQPDATATEAENAQAQPESTPANGGSASDAGISGTSGEDVESIRKKIQSLKSQLSALASQSAQAAQAGAGAESASMSKMNALESQIAALEAQINAMGSEA